MNSTIRNAHRRGVQRRASPLASIRQQARSFVLPLLATAIAGTLGIWLQPRSEPIHDSQPRVVDPATPVHAAAHYPYRDCLESAASVEPAALRVPPHECPSDR